MADNYNWIFHIENNYPKNGWDYWYYCITPRGWQVEGHSVSPGQSYYGSPINPGEKRKLTLKARTTSYRSPKEISFFIGCWNYQGGCVKSQTVKISVKESDALFPNWHYYCNDEYMADSFYDTQSFEMFLELTEQGELTIVSKKNND